MDVDNWEDEEPDEKALRDHGYEVVDDILEPTALSKLRQALDSGSGVRSPDMAFASASQDLAVQVTKALSPAHRELRQ